MLLKIGKMSKIGVTVRAGCARFIFKILDFYNVKSYAFVELAT